MRYVLGAIDRVRDGYAAIVPVSSALRRSAWSSAIGVSGCVGVSLRQDAAELSAGGGSGRFFRRDAIARGRLDQPNRGGRRAGGEHHPAHRGRRRRLVGGRLRLHRRTCRLEPGLSSSSASNPMSSAPTRRKARPRSSNQLRPKLAAIQQAVVFPVQPAAHSRPRQHRRVPICAGGFAGPAAGGYRRDDARHAGRGEPAAGARRRVQHLRRRHAAGLSGHRPRTRRRCSASRSPTSSTRCSRPSAAITSTTSTFSVVPGKSMSRPMRRSETRSTTSSNVYVRNAAGAMVPVRVLRTA